jgi:hypothetical protein
LKAVVYMFSIRGNRIVGVIVRMFASSEVASRFEYAGSAKLKTVKLVFIASPLTNAVLRIKSKDWFARNQDIVPNWSDMSTRGLFQRDSSINI